MGRNKVRLVSMKANERSVQLVRLSLDGAFSLLFALRRAMKGWHGLYTDASVVHSRLNMGNKIMVASVSFLAVAMMLMTAFSMSISSAASVPVSENDKITTEVGTTADLGGGDHFYVKFGSDASFGILWGTQDNPNDIYFVSYIARHIGFINVEEPNGTALTQEPLKVYTLYAVKLDRLIEYSNGSGNSLLSYVPSNLIGELLAGQIYKWVNLDTAWTASNWINGTAQNGDLTWNFTLTAKNLT
jgi:hypothetical protein